MHFSACRVPTPRTAMSSRLSGSSARWLAPFLTTPHIAFAILPPKCASRRSLHTGQLHPLLAGTVPKPNSPFVSLPNTRITWITHYPQPCRTETL